MTERPAIIGITGSAEADGARIVVTLGFDDREYSGAATGDAGEANRSRLVGEATLRAIESITEGRLGMDLVAVATTDFEDVHITMAQVAVQGFDDRLIGSVLAREGDGDAATVRAVLDAINRSLARYL